MPTTDPGFRPARRMDMPDLAAAALVVGAVLAGALHLTRGHAWGDDFAGYIMQARALVEGTPRRFVERNAFTILQSSHPVGPVAYPWGFPLLLAPVFALSGVDPILLKVPGLLLFGAFLVTLHRLARLYVDRWESLIVLLPFAFHPDLLSFLDHVLSDVPFLFFATLTLLLASRVGTPGTGRVASGAMVGAAAFAATFTRSVGGLLLVAFVSVQGLQFFRERPRGRPAEADAWPALAAVAAFSLLAFVSWVVLPGGQGTYLGQAAGASPALAWRNAGLILADTAAFFSGGSGGTWLVAVLLALALAGAAHAGLRGATPVTFTVVYLLVLIAWPEYQGLRFLLPVLPLVALGAVAGVDFLARRAWPSRSGLLVTAACAAWMAFAVVQYVARPPAHDLQVGGGPFGAGSQELFRFVRDRTPPDGVVVFFKPRAMDLMTGRPAVLATDCRHLPRNGHVVLRRTHPGPEELPPDRLLACASRAEVAFENGEFVAYRIQRQP